MKKLDTLKFIKRMGLGKNKLSGTNQMICCPFHGEKNPSLGLVKDIYYDGRSFYCKWGCFTCHTKGVNLEYFVSKHEGISIEDAKEKLRGIFGLEEGTYYIEKFEKEDKKEIKEKKFISEEEYRNNYLRNEPIEYFTKRGFDFNSWILYSFGFSEKSQRMTFPLRDKEGKIISVIGRGINKDIQPKYLYFNKDKENFEKAEHLFGIDLVDYDNKSCIVVEGPLNTVMIKQYGVDNALAIMGSTASKTQFETIFNYFDDITLWFDNDKAGKDCLIKFLKESDKDSRKLKKRFYYIQTNGDAADYSKEEFLEIYNSKKEISSFEINETIKELNGEGGKKESMKRKKDFDLIEYKMNKIKKIK